MHQILHAICTIIFVFMANIKNSYPRRRELLKRGTFRVTRIYYEIDKTVEERIMKHGTSQRGRGSGDGLSEILLILTSCIL